jgi:hypothetical protein
LAYVYNYSGMAASLASGFSKIGVAFILVAPILGWIGVALSGSNTSTNAMFGKFQALVGQILRFPPLLLPTLNSVGAEIGKPVAPQFTRNIYRSFIRPDCTSKQETQNAKIVSLVVKFGALLFIFLLPLHVRLSFRTTRVGSSSRLAVNPDDQGRGEKDPQELIPVEERDAPQHRLDRIVKRHPEQGDEGHEKQELP